MEQKITDDEAIVYFKELLQFETVSALGPDNGSYNACAEWLLKLCAVVNIKASILPESKPNKPIIIAEWYYGIMLSVPVLYLCVCIFAVFAVFAVALVTDSLRLSISIFVFLNLFGFVNVLLSGLVLIQHFRVSFSTATMMWYLLLR